MLRWARLKWLAMALAACVCLSYMFGFSVRTGATEELLKKSLMNAQRGETQRRLQVFGCTPGDEDSWPDICYRFKADQMIQECQDSTLETFGGASLRFATENGRKVEDDDLAIYFLHIEKCGGSSMWNFLKKNEGIKAMNTRFPWQLGGFDLGFHDAHSLPEEELERARELMLPARVIIGHYVHGIHEITPERPYMYVTMMREPLDRLVSQYYFWKKLYDKTYGDNLVDFLTNTTKPQAAHKDNLMTRVLCGREAYETPRGKLTYRHMYCAMQNLRNYSVVLFTDRYDMSIQILRTTFNWPYATQVAERPTLNNGKHQEEGKKQPQEVLEAAKPLTKYDNYLYRLGNCMWELQKQRFYDTSRTPAPPSDEALLAKLKGVRVPEKKVIPFVAPPRPPQLGPEAEE
ncbi:hypothetical protein QOT17_006943 [Balamuthia mandrillaris]